MAVRKTTESRCGNGSVQASQDLRRLHKQPIFTFFYMCMASSFRLCYEVTQWEQQLMCCGENMYSDGVTCHGSF